MTKNSRFFISIIIFIFCFNGKKEAWNFKTPTINDTFDKAIDMTQRLDCDFNKKSKYKNDIACNEANLQSIENLYSLCLNNVESLDDKAIIFSYWAYFLLIYKEDYMGAKQLTSKALEIKPNYDLALFVDIQCDCNLSLSKDNKNIKILIERIEKLDRDRIRVPLMYYCLYSAYISTGQYCKAKELIKTGKFRNDGILVRLFMRYDIYSEMKDIKTNKCPKSLEDE